MILKALKHLVTLLLVLLACATAYTAWSVRIPPSEAGVQSLAWFLFPYMWLALLGAGVISFAFRGWFQFLCCAAACAATWGSASQVIDIPSGRGDAGGSKAYRLLTYNIHYMNYSGEMSASHVRDSICSFLTNSGADVICLQEAPPLAMWGKQMTNDGAWAELTRAYPHIIGTNTGGQIILSKLEVHAADDVTDALRETERKGAIMAADIVCGGDTVRILNCHLASIALSDKQIEAVNSGAEMDEERVSALHKAHDKLTKAFKTREKEAETLTRALAASARETIVCGDFNDTPISYTYHTLTCGERPMNDARRPRRVGLARTYRGQLPPLRIDYVLTSRGIKTCDYAEHDLPTSDHKAVSISFAPAPLK